MSGFLESVQGAFSPLDEEQEESKPLSRAELIENTVFIGDYPLDIILEGIQTQFSNYIDMEDKTNYVDIFYSQLHNSFEVAKNGGNLDNPQEDSEVLDGIYNKFIAKIRELFDLRLSITIADLEDDEPDGPDVEYTVRRLYEFFILGAVNNFKVVIAADVNKRIANISTEEREYFNTLNKLLEEYNPLISTITPTEFLQYRGDREIYDLFENGRVTGNFLRKYTPKLYQNVGYQIDLINYITMVHQFREGIEKSWEDVKVPVAPPEDAKVPEEPVPETPKLDPETKESITSTIPGLLSQIDSSLGN